MMAFLSQPNPHCAPCLLPPHRAYSLSSNTGGDDRALVHLFANGTVLPRQRWGPAKVTSSCECTGGGWGIKGAWCQAKKKRHAVYACRSTAP